MKQNNYIEALEKYFIYYPEPMECTPEELKMHRLLMAMNENELRSLAFNLTSIIKDMNKNRSIYKIKLKINQFINYISKG